MNSSRFSVLLLTACVAVFVGVPGVGGRALAGQPALATPPPPPADADGLTRERLGCGLEVWVYPTGPARAGVGDGLGGGAGEVFLGLLIRAGAVDEGDDQRGAAFIAKQAVGLERPGIPGADFGLFRTGYGERGPAFGAGSRGHGAVSHAFVEYRLVFDAQEARGWDAGLSYARALMAGWSPSDETVLAARQNVMDRPEPEDARARARMDVASALFAGEPIGERPLIPSGDVLAGTTPDAVRRYIAERYTPGSAVLVIVGDIEPGAVLARVGRAFDGVPSREGLACGPAICASNMAGRVHAQAVEGYDCADVSLIAFADDDADGSAGAGSGSGDTSVLDRVASELLGARLRLAAAQAEPELISLNVYAMKWVRGSRISEISVRAEPAGAINAARAVATELARVRRDGWTRSEHQAARARTLDALTGEAARWDAAPARDVFSAMMSSALSGEGWVAPRDALAHAVRVLASTTDDAIAGRARSLFQPGRLNAVVLSPEPRVGLDAGLGRVLFRLAGGSPARVGPPPAVPESLPIGAGAGAVDQIEHDPSIDVWSAVLSNGVQVRVRALPDDPGAPRFDPYSLDEPGPDASKPGGADAREPAGVTLRVALCDGLVGEDGRTLGRSREAAAAWAYARLNDIDAPALRAWVRARGLAFKAFESENRVVLEINGPPGSARDALELAAALLNDPGVDARFVDRVDCGPAGSTPALERMGAMMLRRGDARAGSAVPSGVVDPVVADAWLRRLALAPLEVAVVGDFEPASVLAGAAETLGTLAPRPVPERPTEAWGPLPRDEPSVRVEGEAGEFVQGVVFADTPDLSAVRPMVVASRVLDRQLKRGDDGEGEANAWLWLGDGIPGRVTLVARVTGDAGTIDGAATRVNDAISAIIDGTVPDAAIQEQIDWARRGVDSAWSRRSFWAGRLSALSWNGLKPDSLSGLPADYDAITPTIVRETLARSVGAGVHKRVTIVPPGHR